MNHLAHARLAGSASIDIAANLMGDFIRGRLEDRFSPSIEAGLRLHRAIDSYADAHPLQHRSRNRLEPPFRRYAGVLVDMYYDHFLARHFGRFSDQALGGFTREVYDALERHSDELPERLRVMARHWRRDDLLAGYADLAVLERALDGMSRRLSRDNPLALGCEPLRGEYAGFEEDFLAVFPELLQFAEMERHRIRDALGLRAAS